MLTVLNRHLSYFRERLSLTPCTLVGSTLDLRWRSTLVCLGIRQRKSWRPILGSGPNSSRCTVSSIFQLRHHLNTLGNIELTEYFLEQTEPEPQVSLEDFVTTIAPGQEKEQSLSFIRKMLQWRPEDRLDPDDLLQDEWLVAGLKKYQEDFIADMKRKGYRDDDD